jgi:hypothetical protein
MKTDAQSSNIESPLFLQNTDPLQMERQLQGQFAGHSPSYAPNEVRDSDRDPVIGALSARQARPRLRSTVFLAKY